jgi:NDP-sugar pyrophosphorylase family protein
VLENGKMVELLLRENAASARGTRAEVEMSNVEVVIMAGGLGTRLKPFTTIFPKPLTPVGDRSIIEVIMDKFARYGMTRFRLSVGHKVKLLKAYLEDANLGYSIAYVNEEKPLGTAGALSKMVGQINDTFFVSNCDIIVDDNYAAMYEYHRKQGFSLTVICSMQHHTIPYGVCDIEEGGVLKGIKEKPQYDFLVNTGFYVLEPETLGLIPQDSRFDMTDLIFKLQESGKKVGVFPVSEKAWVDIGQLDEYMKTLERLNYLVK